MDNPADNTERILGYLDALFKAIASVAGLVWTARFTSRKLKAREEKERVDRESTLQALFVAGIEKSQDRSENLIEDYEERLARAAEDLEVARKESRELERKYLAEVTELKIENSSLRASMRTHGGKLKE